MHRWCVSLGVMAVLVMSIYVFPRGDNNVDPRVKPAGVEKQR